MVVTALQIWVFVVLAVMMIYATRHWIFTWNRLSRRQRPFYQDLIDSDEPPISVLVPMHNEGVVARDVLEALIASDYPKDRLEIVPIDDRSTDETTAILVEYAQRYDFIRPIYLRSGTRGKPSALNAALEAARHEVVLVFDADYTPGKDLLRELAMAFVDPEVGAVMGRVVPRNTADNTLTRLLSLERSGGYQVDQQARYNLDLVPQFGGTVGGFRRSVVRELHGFDPLTLAEDTDLTARLFLNGWRVVYANRAECYEEVPDTWESRFRQLRRWARGHTRAFTRYGFRMLAAHKLPFWQRIDGWLLLFVYFVPVILLSGIVASALLFYMGRWPIVPGILFVFFVVAFNAYGNFGPVYEVAAAELLDGSHERLYLLPVLFYLFVYNMYAVFSGVLDAIGDAVKNRRATWDKTQRNGSAVKQRASA
ncbi:MAG: glycosyltransferase [Vulcanimicrobiaceae bacterium]